MYNINLYPRKKAIEVYFTFWLILIGLIGITLIAVQISISEENKHEYESMNAEIQSLDVRIGNQNQKLIPNEKTVSFNLLHAEVQSLQDRNNDELSDLIDVFGALPDTATIVNMVMSENDVLAAELLFKTDKDYIAFVNEIGQQPQIKTIKVSEIVKTVAGKSDNEVVNTLESIIPNTPVTSGNVSNEGNAFDTLADKLKVIFDQQNQSSSTAQSNLSDDPYYRVIMELQLQPSGKAGS